MVETGFWIILDPRTGYYTTQDLTGPATAREIEPGTKPANAIGLVHTHPVVQDDVFPSEADIHAYQDFNVTGIVVTHKGLYFAGPQSAPQPPYP
jgi:hypothetical protein